MRDQYRALDRQCVILSWAVASRLKTPLHQACFVASCFDGTWESQEEKLPCQSIWYIVLIFLVPGTNI